MRRDQSVPTLAETVAHCTVSRRRGSKAAMTRSFTLITSCLALALVCLPACDKKADEKKADDKQADKKADDKKADDKADKAAEPADPAEGGDDGDGGEGEPE